MGNTQLQFAINAPLFGPEEADTDVLRAEARRDSPRGGSSRRKSLLSGEDFILPDLVVHAENGDLSVAINGTTDRAQLEQIFQLAESSEQPLMSFSALSLADQNLEKRRYLDYLKREPKKGVSRNEELEVWLLGGSDAEANFLSWYDRKQQRRSEALKRKANRLANCGVCGRRLDCSNHPEEHKFFGEFQCESRYCRRCGEKVFAKLFGKYIGLWPIVKGMRPQPGFRSSVVIAQLDFTAVNLERMPKPQEIREFNQDIRECVKRVMREAGLGSEHYGFLWCDEFGGWNQKKQSYNTNLHAHGIYVGPFVQQKLFAANWAAIRAEKDGAKVVWIRKQQIDNPPANFSEAEKRRFVRCLGHALKYTGKHVARSDGRRLAELEAAFHGIRRVHTMGLFYNADLACSASCDGCGPRECSARCALPNGHDGPHRCDGGSENRCPICNGHLMFPHDSGYAPVANFKKEGRRNLEQVRREVARDRVFGGPRGPGAE
jgi:hypothetical protein